MKLDIWKKHLYFSLFLDKGENALQSDEGAFKVNY